MVADVTEPSLLGPTESGLARTRRLYQALTASLPSDLRTIEVAIGLHWTAVVVEDGGRLQCGLASTVAAEHAHGEAPDVALAGQLVDRSPEQLAELAHASSPTERAVGLAAINASLVRQPETWQETSAAEVIVHKGKDKRVALIGHFPFISELRQQVGELVVLELNPGEGELPASAAKDVLPTCSVVAITGTTLINGTFGDLMDSVVPGAYTMLLGPSSPLSAELFDHGIDLVAGTDVVRIQPVMRAIKQGATYRQIHRLGTRLVTLSAQSTLA
jgi:uncharacterized protein (DUF4213/DUF364 family)